MQAAARYAEARERALTLGDSEVVAEAEYGFGIVAVLAGDLEQAETLFAQSLTAYRELGLGRAAWVAYASGYVALQRGETNSAQALFAESLRHALGIFLVEVSAYTLIGLAVIDAQAGNIAHAAARLGSANAICELFSCREDFFEPRLRAMLDRAPAARGSRRLRRSDRAEQDAHERSHTTGNFSQ